MDWGWHGIWQNERNEHRREFRQREVSAGIELKTSLVVRCVVPQWTRLVAPVHGRTQLADGGNAGGTEEEKR